MAETETSQFNEAGLQIARLGQLWSEVSYYSINGDIEKYRWLIERVWLELCADAVRLGGNTLEEFDEIDVKNKYCARIKELDEQINEAFLKEHKSTAYNLLKKKDMFLRLLQEAAGKGSILKDLEDEREML